MTINRTKIANIKPFKDICLLCECCLQGISKHLKSNFTTFVYQSDLFKEHIQTIPDFIIGRRCGKIDEILRKTSFDRVDCHLIIIQNNQHVIFTHRCIIQTFECQSACHRPITNHGNDTSLVIFQQRSHRHAQSSRNGCRCMSHTKSIVFTLINFWKATDTTQFSVCMKLISATGQNFMSVSLMTNIPYYSIFGSVKHIMKSHS